MKPRDRSIQVAHECACFAARRASRAITRLYEEPVAEAGLEPTQFTLLNAVLLLEPAPIGRLAWAIQAEETTVARNLRLLERKGLVAIDASERDRRVREVRLTPAGRERLDAAQRGWREAQRRLEERLGKRRARALVKSLQEAADLLREP
ncbi:MAG: MarR family winged helix-turn-helix transcriptional regulator [Myxococcota bacterium]|nr:MarR family winged helix-turn-helix transcriptional regulator [Myxococcota bacterium]